MKVLSDHLLVDKVAVVLGTRPGIIKMAPIIREMERREMGFIIIHTGQHYTYEMDELFFKSLGIPKPSHINPMTKRHETHGAQTAEMLRFVEAVLIDVAPAKVIVGGDANTNLAGALAARKLGLSLYHLEAGLRSRDWRMPEEHNRVVIDHISDVLLAPTAYAARNLNREDVKGIIHVVGNTIVDAVFQNLEVAKLESSVLDNLEVLPQQYAVLTLHREENVDNFDTMQDLFDTLSEVFRAPHDLPIVFPIHPRTRKMIHVPLSRVPNIKVCKPLGYFDFLKLLDSAKFVMTDSGGVQEEACILQVPCLTLRNNTERPETVLTGANKIVGDSGQTLLKGLQSFEGKVDRWDNPFGDGKSAEKICDVFQEEGR